MAVEFHQVVELVRDDLRLDAQARGDELCGHRLVVDHVLCVEVHHAAHGGEPFPGEFLVAGALPEFELQTGEVIAYRDAEGSGAFRQFRAQEV